MNGRDGTVLTLVCGLQAGLVTAKIIGAIDYHWVIVLVPLWGAFVSAALFLLAFSVADLVRGFRR